MNGGGKCNIACNQRHYNTIYVSGVTKWYSNRLLIRQVRNKNDNYDVKYYYPVR